MGVLALLLSGSATAATAQQQVNLPAAARMLPGAPADVFTVGAEEGESWELLSDVRAAVFDSKDNLYVLDSGNFRVLVFDARGGFVRQIGKQGSGPGEFSFPTGIAITRDGHLVVGDNGRRVYSVFKTDGTYVRSVALPDERGVLRMGTGTAIAADPAGWLVTHTMPRFGRPGEPVDQTPTSPLWKQPMEDGASGATIYEFPQPKPQVRDQNAGGRRGRVVMSVRPTFSPADTWAVLPTGSVAVSNDAAYRVAIYGPNGAVERVIAKPVTPRRISKRDQEEARARERARMAAGQGTVRVAVGSGAATFSAGGGSGGNIPSEAEIEQRMEQMTFADVMPSIGALLSDPTGRLWIQQYSPDPAKPGPIDLVKSDGTYIGTVATPLPAAVSASGLAAYIERDELDVQQIVVRRLPAQWAAR